MAVSTIITDYVGRGTAASRPATPNIPAGATALFVATDTDKASLWDGSEWLDIGFGTFGHVIRRPTVAALPFTTWGNQGTSTITDNDIGVTLFKASHVGDNYSRYTVAAPATPYSYRALIALTQTEAIVSGGNGSIGLGWSDGTKHQFITLKHDGASERPLFVQSYTNNTTFSANNYLGEIDHDRVWVDIRDDGTTVYFKFSNDGVNFVTAYSVAKASGFLGASGYSNPGLFIQAAGGDAYGSLMSFKTGS